MVVAAYTPKEYICPITKEIMETPVMSRHGVNFEKSAIMNWLQQGKPYCPVTGQPLRLSGLVSNKTLKWKIDYWLDKHHHHHHDDNDQGKTDKDNDDNGHLEKMSNFFGYVAVTPDRFICPLTKEIMKEPVMSKEGVVFEKEAIFAWLESYDICPVNGTPLTPNKLISNKKLQWEIEKWHETHGDRGTKISDLEYETKIYKAEMISKEERHISDILHALCHHSDDEGGDDDGDNENDDKDKIGGEKSGDRRDVLFLLDEVVDFVENNDEA